MLFESFDQFRELYRREARQAFCDLQKRRPNELIYGFALHTSDAATDANAIGVTEEWYAERTKDATSFLDRTVLNPAVRYSTEEWPGIYSADFPAADDGIDPVERMEACSGFAEQWSTQPGHSYAMFRKQSFRAMAEALQSLDHEGLFGTGRDRERITIFLSISDSEDAGCLERESARLLNPRRSARKLTAAFPIPIRWIPGIAASWHWIKRGRLIA